MKNTLLVIVVMLVVGCGENDTKPHPNKIIIDRELRLSGELTAEHKRVIGKYEIKLDHHKLGLVPFRWVFLENGIAEFKINGNQIGKIELPDERIWFTDPFYEVANSAKDLLINWKIVDGEIHATGKDGKKLIYKINKYGNIIQIAIVFKGGKREDVPKEEQLTFKKIK